MQKRKRMQKRKQKQKQSEKRMLWLSTTELAHALIVLPRPIALAGRGKVSMWSSSQANFLFRIRKRFPTLFKEMYEKLAHW